MSDSFNIEPLSRLIPAKLVVPKDSSKDRQNHQEKKQKKDTDPDIIDEIEEEIEEESLLEEGSFESGKQKPPHFDDFA
jgi:hypothetical protein